jgi:hypothetical protein
MMEAVRSSETLALIRATQRNNPEDGILHSHRRENLKIYISFCFLSHHCFGKKCAITIITVDKWRKHRLCVLPETFVSSARLHNTPKYKVFCSIFSGILPISSSFTFTDQAV